MKRFQECNRIVKFFRYRWYLTIPFIWIWHSVFSSLKVYKDEMCGKNIVHTEKYFILKGKMLWSIIKGQMQSKMKWYYTSEEVFKDLKNL